MYFSTTNNFDLIRLFAAIQVAVIHAAWHLDYTSRWIELLSLFPGVPIFFFVSGFLIYGSYEKSLGDDKPVLNFIKKRFLRLYPALWACVIFSALILLFSGYLSMGSVEYSFSDFAVWILASSTIFQFFNPDFLRGFGVGVINGSLWTIAVEIQFYILTPFIFILLKKKHLLVIILAILILANLTNTYFNPKDSIIEKLAAVSFVPWFYMFLIGAATYKHHKIMEIVSKVPFVLLIFMYCFIWYFSKMIGLVWGNGIHFIGYIFLVPIILKLAFLRPSLSDKILRRNDISYGVYIYHMPLINLFVFNDFTGLLSIVIVLLLTLCTALFSWVVIERPALQLKSKQLRSTL